MKCDINGSIYPQILQVGNEDPNMHSVFADVFSDLGRLDNITLVMVFHPQYFESFLKTQHYLLQMDGPLPACYQHYIGIMVSLMLLLYTLLGLTIDRRM